MDSTEEQQQQQQESEMMKQDTEEYVNNVDNYPIEGQDKEQQQNTETSPNGVGNKTENDNVDNENELKEEKVEEEYNEIMKDLLSKQIHKEIAIKVNELVTSNLIKLDDFDETSFNLLKDLNESEAFMIDEFALNDFSTIENKNDLLTSTVNRLRNEAKMLAKSSGSRPGPDESILKELLEKSGYAHEVTAGQRKYGGPPPNWEGAMPGNGCEVFVGKLPKDVFEDLLVPLFEEFGRIWDLRIMVESTTGFTKGYAFVTYCDKDDAKKAADKLNGFEIKPGKSLRVNISIANVRLFVGNIPKTKTKEEIKEEFSKLIEGITDVIIYQPTEDGDKLKNRGFCFLDFDSHKSAATARKKLLNTRLRLFNRDIAVEWAEQTDDPDDEQMSKVKTLYVRNISSEVTEEEIKEKFEPYGGIERVRKVKDYAFVHYNERDDALKAMDELNGKSLGKFNLIISLARPLSDNRKPPPRRDDKKRIDSLMKPGPGNHGNRGNNNSRGGGSNNHHMNNNNNMNENFNETFFAAMGSFMRNFNYDNMPNTDALAMQFAAAAAAAAGVPNDMPNGNRKTNSYQNNNYNNNRTNNNNNRGGGSNNNNRGNNSNYMNKNNFNDRNNRGPNINNGQGGSKRKTDHNNLNDNKKGRFNINNNFNNDNIGGTFQNASAYPIPQQPQSLQQQQQPQQDFSQDFYAPQWS